MVRLFSDASLLLREGPRGQGHGRSRVKYGCKLNATRDGLLVDEDKMRNVRRVFCMVGTEGHSMNAVYKTFERERIPTPGGGKRSRYQDMAAEGHITFDELGAKLRDLAAERAMVESEPENLQLRRSRAEELERDKASLLEDYAGMVSEDLDELTGEERHQIYRMLRLRVRVQFDDTIEVEGVLREAISTPMDTRLRILQSTNSSEPRFRSRLSEGRMPRLELTRALRTGIAIFVRLEGGGPTYHVRTFRRRSCVPQAP